ncbi:MAG: PepSY-associated TM helix domain-containing protein [Acidobacteria bacterium]|nr:PepSY-associated TM helix domain-containing protein [Acidobacteriota bacterium]
MPSSANWGARLTAWNRRLHYYVGLYLLFFLWLFCFTGLLLNHSKWAFAEFWANRQQSDREVAIAGVPPGGDLEQAREIARQAGLHGEIEWTRTRANAERLEFRVSRPGHIAEVKADFERGRAAIHRIELNAWGVTRILHTFTGVRMGDERNERDWGMTQAWAFSMDALAAGLIFLTLSSLYMWWRRSEKRRAGAIALACGAASCGWFVVGLRWFA